MKARFSPDPTDSRRPLTHKKFHPLPPSFHPFQPYIYMYPRSNLYTSIPKGSPFYKALNLPIKCLQHLSFGPNSVPRQGGIVVINSLMYPYPTRYLSHSLLPSSYTNIRIGANQGVLQKSIIIIIIFFYIFFCHALQHLQGCRR